MILQSYRAKTTLHFPAYYNPDKDTKYNCKQHRHSIHTYKMHCKYNVVIVVSFYYVDSSNLDLDTGT